METLTTIIGLAAACGTTFSYIPQVRKLWRTRSAADLSLWMILLLSTGVSLWIVYGILQEDAVIIIANAISLLLLANILVFKLLELRRGRSGRQRAAAA